MTEWRASAPGKAVLFGEYAVLGGAPALVMAVDRHARVRISPRKAPAWCVNAAQLGLPDLEFQVDRAGRVSWSSDQADTPSFARCRALIEWEVARHPDQFPALAGHEILIDTADLYENDGARVRKLGLGSSAAMAIARVGALEACANGTVRAGLPDELASTLLARYRAGQGGQGSGIDLAAALHGGVQAYQLTDQGGSIAPVVLPEMLSLRFFWTGKPAVTGNFLKQFRRWEQARPEQAEAALADLGRLSITGLQAIGRGDVNGVMTCINSYGDSMGKIGAMMGMDVMTPALDAIVSAARAHGLAAKPCGAGGGDLAVVAGHDSDALARVEQALHEQGYRRLALAVAPEGLRVRRTAHAPPSP